MSNPWTEPTPVYSEGKFTPWGEGWTAWNGCAAECEFVEFVGSLVKLIRPDVIIETGAGMGFTTRGILPYMHDDAVLHLHETDEGLWGQIPDFRNVISHLGIPSSTTWRDCDLAIIGSTPEIGNTEISDFARHAGQDAVLLVHDVNRRELWRHIELLSPWVTGTYLPHPRKSWIGSKTCP